MECEEWGVRRREWGVRRVESEKWGVDCCRSERQDDCESKSKGECSQALCCAV